MARVDPLQPRKKPVQERSRLTVERILDAASQVFSERGFAGGTTNHIAERARVSVGSLYQYFPNKDAILMGLMERHMAQGQEEIARWVGRMGNGDIDRRGLLRAVVETLVSDHTTDPRLHRVLLEASLRSPSLLQKGREMVDEMALQVERVLQQTPGTRVKDLALASRLATLTGFILTHWYILFGAEQIHTGKFIDQVVDMLSVYLFGEDPANP